MSSIRWITAFRFLCRKPSVVILSQLTRFVPITWNGSERRLALLQSLKGPRFVFTNGRHDWSEAGMAHMGIYSAIDAVFDLKQLNWVGKPHDSAYEKMEKWLAERLADMGLSMPKDPREIVLLEDSLRNLEPAHRRGWTTIFVNPTPDTPDWVDFHIPHILELGRLNLKNVIASEARQST